jgi:hypothetical protein
MNRLFLLLASIFWVSTASAQRGRDLGWVQGTVVDASTNEGLPFVRIIFSSSTGADTTVTDFDGFYLIRTPKRKLALRLDHTGYETYRSEVDPKDRIIFHDIALSSVKLKLGN